MLDGYTISAIYRGGFGEVYYALSDAGREVALKLLQNNSEIELRGVQQCLNLSHPNLVTIFDVRQDADGDHWIIMEYIGGETLDQAVRANPVGMPMETVRKWLRGVCDGVSYLHSRGLVHRDLKPANIFSDDGIIKVGDVGLSKFITPSRRSAQTQSVGTVYYMAPEVARGRYGKEVDTYALGVMLYEMLTGHVPFDGESTGEILMKHLTEKPDLSKLPPRMQPVVGRALEKDPSKRFATADEFLAAFDAAVHGRPLDIPADAFEGGRRGDGQPRPQPPPLKPQPGQPRTLAPQVRDNVACRPTSFRGRMQQCNLHWGKVLLMGGLVGFLWGRLNDDGSGTVWRATSMGVLIALVAAPVVRRFVGGKPHASDMQQPRVVQPVAVRQPDGTLQPVGMPRNIAQKPLMDAQAGGYRPLASRPLGRRARAAQWLTSAAIAPVIVAALTAALVLLAPSLLCYPSETTPRPSSIALFSLTALAGSWLLTAAVKLQESHWRQPGAGGEDARKRLVQAVAGGLTGAVAFAVASYLNINEQSLFGWKGERGLFESLGENPLVGSGGPGAGDPTLLGHIVFFAGLFGLRAWWRQIDLGREGRFRPVSVLLTLVVAWLWAAVFTFPQVWGLLWAAVISATVQLASPWMPAARPSEQAKGLRR
ncbi:MAG: serine/threonine-protein kinase [Planctomycetaceae bacterium]